jgi:hypothetical protein
METVEIIMESFENDKLDDMVLKLNNEENYVKDKKENKI